MKGGQGKTQGAWTSGVKQVESSVTASYRREIDRCPASLVWPHPEKRERPHWSGESCSLQCLGRKSRKQKQMLERYVSRKT